MYVCMCVCVRVRECITCILVPEAGMMDGCLPSVPAATTASAEYLQCATREVQLLGFGTHVVPIYCMYKYPAGETKSSRRPPAKASTFLRPFPTHSSLPDTAAAPRLRIRLIDSRNHSDSPPASLSTARFSFGAAHSCPIKLSHYYFRAHCRLIGFSLRKESLGLNDRPRRLPAATSPDPPRTTSLSSRPS